MAASSSDQPCTALPSSELIPLPCVNSLHVFRLKKSGHVPHYADEYLGLLPLDMSVDFAATGRLYLLHWCSGHSNRGIWKQQFSASTNWETMEPAIATRAPFMAGTSTAHNLHFLSPAGQLQANQELGGPFHYYGIGGQYFSPERAKSKRFLSDAYDGIRLVKMPASNPCWAEKDLLLVTGAHPGAVEMRKKCAPYAEFDGQSCMVWSGYHGLWFLYARSNNCIHGGYRNVQVVTSPTLKGPWSSFQPVSFSNTPADVNVYFMHAYCIGPYHLGILPMTWKGVKPPGIYWCISLNGVAFTEPQVLYESAQEFEDRSPDLPVFGAIMIAQGMLLPIYQNAKKRMSSQQQQATPPPEIWWWGCQFEPCPWAWVFAPPPPPPQDPEPGPTLPEPVHGVAERCSYEELGEAIMEVFIAVHSKEPPDYWDVLPALENLYICPEHFEQMLLLTESHVEWRCLVRDLVQWHPYQWRRQQYWEEFKEIGRSSKSFCSMCM